RVVQAAVMGPERLRALRLRQRRPTRPGASPTACFAANYTPAPQPPPWPGHAALESASTGASRGVDPTRTRHPVTRAPCCVGGAVPGSQEGSAPAVHRSISLLLSRTGGPPHQGSVG